ncbi:MAG: hypothetical protein V1690_02820 [Candidatus Moraniibacteriota bacterium]
MKKNDVITYGKNTAEYIFMHAKWRRARGRNPSAAFSWETNPKKALACAVKLAFLSVSDMVRRQEEAMRFFAVTSTSIYEVVIKDEKGSPFIRKISLQGESRVSVGGIMSGPMLAIAKWLQFYTPEGHSLLSPQTSFERRLEMVNTQFWKGKTSHITALFLTKEKAKKCFSFLDRELCDPRWREETEAIIRAIGENHPTITICHFPELALLRSHE